MTSTKEEVRDRLAAALTEVTLAEDALAKTLRELGSGGPRAEKVAITEIVTDAFSRLQRAHEALSRVRDLIESE